MKKLQNRIVRGLLLMILAFGIVSYASSPVYANETHSKVEGTLIAPDSSSDSESQNSHDEESANEGDQTSDSLLPQLGEGNITILTIVGAVLIVFIGILYLFIYKKEENGNEN